MNPHFDPEIDPVGALRQLLDDQLLGVLGSQFKGAPYSNLVAFASVENDRRLVFATARSTRKYRNLSANRHTSMLIDNRENAPGDFAEALAVTALGTCREPTGDELEFMRQALLTRHPQLTHFLTSPSCAVMVIDVESYVLVWRFQQVVEIHPE